MTRGRHAVRMSLLLITLSLAACISIGPTNPEISLDDRQVNDSWRELRARPGALDRPVIVLGGWRSPAFTATGLKANLIRATGAPPEQFADRSYPFITDIEDAARAVVEQVEQTWPSDDPHATVPIDAVAISMGGLVARAAQLPPPDGAPPRKRLNLTRLFTLATPHRGSPVAAHIAPDEAARDMKPGSPFLARLDDALEDNQFELIPYAVLNDFMVGATNTAPPDQPVYWTRGTLLFSHYRITSNRAILVDIARRLRNEPPIFNAPSTPPRN